MPAWLNEKPDEKFLEQLKINFVKSNQTTCTEIKKAVDNGDIKLAHRLAHTLKSNAGQIGRKKLWEAAKTVETMLSGKGDFFAEEHINILDTELKSVLAELAPLLTKINIKNKTKTIDAEKMRELLGELETMLLNRNPGCMNLLDDIRAIPDAEELVQQVENFEFKKASIALSALKGKMGI